MICVLLSLLLIFSGQVKILGGTPATNTTSRIFNGSSDFLNSAATLDLTAYNQLSGSYDVNWTTNANNDALLAELFTNFNNCNTGGKRCFIIDPNDSASTAYAINLHSQAASSSTCTFTRPSAGAKHRIAWAWDISVNPNTCAVWVDGVAQTTTTGGTLTATADTFENQTLYLMSRAGTTLFGTGTLSRFAIYGGHILTNTEGQNLTSTSSCTSPTTITGNVLYLPFNGVSPETDNSGGGHSFAVTGTTTGTATCP